MKTGSALAGTMILLIGAFMGILIGPPLLNYHPDPSPPTDHREIADSFSIIDTVYNSVLLPECVESVKSPQLSAVTSGKEYLNSVWIFYTFESQGYAGKDANAAMDLWGPLDDGSYSGMVSRLAGNELVVYYK